MASVGIIGGIAPESTIEYYRLILERHRELAPDRGNPSVIINSIDLQRMIGMVAANELDRVTDYLAAEVARLADAGVDFAAFASNTPHIVFDGIVRASSIPLISIVEVTAAEVQPRGLRKVGLLGTRFTMQGRFYPEVLARRGIEVVAPPPADQTYVHDKYMSELINASFLDETRAGLLGVVDRLREHHAVEGIILGGTELPLILRATEYHGMPFFDTTRIHVEAIVQRLLQ
ncbi:MAG: aspartate/glutamate racemase family protein [Thermoanaerobaculia bacterium]